MQEATLEQAKELGLLESEFEDIKKIMGRTPNFTSSRRVTCCPPVWCCSPCRLS